MGIACTASGRLLDFERVEDWDITLHDIAFSLSQIPRFNGHAKHHYSVATHSINVATMAAQFGSDSQSIQWLTACALIHDAHEAYVQDIIMPLKTSQRWVWPDRKELEYTVDKRIRECLHFPQAWYSNTYRELVKEAEKEVLYYELWYLMHPNCRQFFDYPWAPYTEEGSVGKAIADTMQTLISPTNAYIQFMTLLEHYFPEASKGV